VAPDVEWRPTGAFIGLDGVYRGPDAIEEWMDTIRAEWEEFEVSLLEVLEEAPDSLLVTERIWGRGRESGAEAEMRVYSAYGFDSEGRVNRRASFTELEPAREAFRS